MAKLDPQPLDKLVKLSAPWLSGLTPRLGKPRDADDLSDIAHALPFLEDIRPAADLIESFRLFTTRSSRLFFGYDVPAKMAAEDKKKKHPSLIEGGATAGQCRAQLVSLITNGKVTYNHHAGVRFGRNRCLALIVFDWVLWLAAPEEPAVRHPRAHSVFSGLFHNLQVVPFSDWPKLLVAGYDEYQKSLANPVRPTNQSVADVKTISKEENAVHGNIAAFGLALRALLSLPAPTEDERDPAEPLFERDDHRFLLEVLKADLAARGALSDVAGESPDALRKATGMHLMDNLIPVLLFGLGHSVVPLLCGENYTRRTAVPSPQLLGLWSCHGNEVLLDLDHPLSRIERVFGVELLRYAVGATKTVDDALAAFWGDAQVIAVLDLVRNGSLSQLQIKALRMIFFFSPPCSPSLSPACADYRAFHPDEVARYREKERRTKRKKAETMADQLPVDEHAALNATMFNMHELIIFDDDEEEYIPYDEGLVVVAGSSFPSPTSPSVGTFSVALWPANPKTAAASPPAGGNDAAKGPGVDPPDVRMSSPHDEECEEPQGGRGITGSVGGASTNGNSAAAGAAAAAKGPGVDPPDVRMSSPPGESPHGGVSGEGGKSGRVITESVSRNGKGHGGPSSAPDEQRNKLRDRTALSSPAKATSASTAQPPSRGRKSHASASKAGSSKNSSQPEKRFFAFASPEAYYPKQKHLSERKKRFPILKDAPHTWSPPYSTVIWYPGQNGDLLEYTLHEYRFFAKFEDAKIVSEFLSNQKDSPILHRSAWDIDPHLKPSATQSGVVHISQDDFDGLAADEQAELLKNRVVNMQEIGAEPPPPFDLETLSRFRNPSDLINIQDVGMDDVEKEWSRVGTSRDLLDPGMPPLNSLDNPLPSGVIPMEPRHAELALQHLEGHEGLPQYSTPWGHFRWTVETTAGGRTGPHADVIATTFTVLTGVKLAFFAVPLDPDGGGAGDLSSRFCGAKWDQAADTGLPGVYRWEALLLMPGNTVYFGHGVRHWVFTLENSIAYGRHTIFMPQIRLAVYNILHQVATDDETTNADHAYAHRILVRMFIAWVDKIVLGEARSAHFPAVNSPTILRDLVVLQAFVALFPAWEVSSYRAISQGSGPYGQPLALEPDRYLDWMFALHSAARLRSHFEGRLDIRVTAGPITFADASTDAVLQMACAMCRYRVEFAARQKTIKASKASPPLAPFFTANKLTHQLRRSVVAYEIATTTPPQPFRGVDHFTFDDAAGPTGLCKRLNAWLGNDKAKYERFVPPFKGLAVTAATPKPPPGPSPERSDDGDNEDEPTPDHSPERFDDGDNEDEPTPDQSPERLDDGDNEDEPTPDQSPEPSGDEEDRPEPPPSRRRRRGSPSTEEEAPSAKRGRRKGPHDRIRVLPQLLGKYVVL
ncbi:hypothetical protein C8R43DRAFT_1118524 [Mycena crocata]|nr:hypothetical protein C8R43DRAFT_1118524 [Mycena crocata]